MHRPDPANVTVRKTEIAQRYQRAAEHRNGGPFNRGKLRVAEVSRLAKDRRKRGALDFDCEAVIADIRSDLRTWTAESIGKRLKVKWEEQKRLCLRAIVSCDLAPDALDKEKKKHAAELALNRQKRRRMKMKLHPEDYPPPAQKAARSGLPARAAAVLDRAAQEWKTVGQITADLRRSRAFHGLRDRSRHEIVGKLVMQLVEQGRLEQRIEKTPARRYGIRYIRLPSKGSNSGSFHYNTLATPEWRAIVPIPLQRRDGP